MSGDELVEEDIDESQLNTYSPVSAILCDSPTPEPLFPQYL